MSFRMDWKCPKCGTMSHDVPTKYTDQWCPFCGIQMEKVYTPPVVIFKGSGWTERFHGGKKE